MSLPSLVNKSLYENSEEAFSDNEEKFTYQTGVRASPNKTQTADTFTRDLSRVQEEQIAILRKIERERRREIVLNSGIEEAKTRLRSIQDKTKNGHIVHEHETTNKKLLVRLEHQLQMSKVKLSTARNENISLKHRVQDLRREKLLHLQILNDLIKEASTARRRAKFCAKEIAVMNEKKLKVKMSSSTIKQKMVRDMEEFSSELEKAKNNITNAQTTILTTIREKLQSTSTSVVEASMFFDTAATIAASPGSPARPKSTVGSSKGPRPEALIREVGHSASEAEALLRDTDFGSVEELVVALQSSEESMFALYHDTQSRHEEVEKMELDNKHLEQQVELQMKRLHELEGNQELVKQELEKNIQNLRQTIDKYDAEYGRNMEVLQSCSESLLNLLRNIAMDENALDQQLLSTGITDRNVDDFLGLIEQRIDELIQMSKAANKQAIKRDDFVKLSQADTKVAGFQAPIPPSLHDTGDDDDDFDEVAGKLQPLNIHVLKEIIHKKVQRMVVPQGVRKLDKQHMLGGMTGGSRAVSTASLRSTNSAKSRHQSFNQQD